MQEPTAKVREPTTTNPTRVRDGLAMYRRGDGPEVLLLPYPHASGGGPMVDGPLADLLVRAGRCVITFDPPDQYRSTRPSEVTVPEMVACAAETLGELRVPLPVAVLGHSMSALCAFAFGLEHPDAVSGLVLVGTPPGSGTSLVRYRAMPFHWPPWHPDLWRMATWGTLLALGRGTLATHQRLERLLARENFVDQTLAPHVVVEPGDRQRPPPPRDRWWLAIRGVRLVPLAAGLRCRTLLVVGRHDHQTPPRVSAALRRRIPDSHLEVFDRSGHSPFVEEPDRFEDVVLGFLDRDTERVRKRDDGVS